MIGEAVMKLDLPYLMQTKSRKGKPYYYVRRGKELARVHGKPGSPEFLASYTDAVHKVGGKSAETCGTWRWLCTAYMASSRFRALAPPTRRQRELVLQHTWTEPRAADAAEKMGDCPLRYFQRNAVVWLQERKGDNPEAANHRVKAIRAVFKWAIRAGQWSDDNPARDIDRLASKRTDGHHTWTAGEVEQYCARHPVGTKARLALAIFLFTGARISDVARFGRPMVQAGQLCWTEAKGAARTPKEREIPILPELQAVLDATTLTGTKTWLVTQYGRAFTVKGLGQWFRKRCDEAGLPHCSAHGLRKAGATIAAENGATDRQLMAVFGWATAKQVSTYTRAADQKRLARDAIGLLVRKGD